MGVLTIKNRIDKPFYITKKIDKARPYHIYSRYGDRNTAIDSQADEALIENMWKERFGLNLTFHERFDLYVADVNNWDYNHRDTFVHKIYPDFRFCMVEE